MRIDKRQSVVLIITILLFACLVLEAYRLIQSDILPSHSHIIINPISTSSTKPTATPDPKKNIPVFQSHLPASISHRQGQLVTHTQKYIALVNQYQMAKIERQLLEEQVAIAQAHQKIAEISQKTRQLTESSAPPQNPKSLSALGATTVIDPPAQLPVHASTPSQLPNTSDFTDLTQIKNKLSDPPPQSNDPTPTATTRSTNDDKTQSLVMDVSDPKPNSVQSYSLDEMLLLELPSTCYTIYLRSDTDKHALALFAQVNALGDNAIYYSLPNEHKKRYVLLYSYFNTKAEAESALQKLPPPLKKHHPKIISIATIQDVIKSKKNEADG